MGQYYLRARYYDPANGAFTQMDTYQGRMGEPVSLHKYLYGNGNPVNGIDPSGNVTIARTMATVNTAVTLASLSLVAVDVLQMAADGKDISAKEVGVSILLSMTGTPGKFLKLVNKKLCGKKGCKVPPILDEEHIFKGEIRRPRPKPLGFHSTAMSEYMIGKTGTKIKRVLKRGRKGIYKARVSIWDDYTKRFRDKDSTMFPRHWSRSMVSASLYAAWNKNNGKPRSGFKDILVGGIKIRYYVEGIWLRGHPVMRRF